MTYDVCNADVKTGLVKFSKYNSDVSCHMISSIKKTVNWTRPKFIATNDFKVELDGNPMISVPKFSPLREATFSMSDEYRGVSGEYTIWMPVSGWATSNGPKWVRELLG